MPGRGGRRREGGGSRSRILTLLLAAVAALAVGIIRDHVHHDYTRVGSLAEVMQRAAALPEPPGFRGWLAPDDARYLAFTAEGWQFWLGRSAILQGFYVRVPDLAAPSIELLVRGEQGHPAPLTFELAARPGGTGRFTIERVLRAGTPVGETGRTLEAIPLTMGGRLAVSSTGAGESYRDHPPLDRDGFSGLDRFTARGLLERTPGGLELRTPSFLLAIEPSLEPGLAVFLEDLAGTRVSEDAVYFLRRVAPAAGGVPGEGAGRVHLDAMALGDLFIRNEGRP